MVICEGRFRSDSHESVTAVYSGFRNQHILGSPMRISFLTVLLLVMGCFAVRPAHAVSASDLSDTCQKAGTAISGKGKWDGKRPEAIYAAGQCEGFIEGWIAGINGSILNGKNGLVIVSVREDQIKSMWDIAQALAQHLKDAPLDSGKPADSVLQQILLDSGLITTSPAPTASPTPSTYRPTSAARQRAGKRSTVVE